MKRINLIIVAIATLFFIVSCKKDDAPISNNPEGTLKDDSSESLPINLNVLENGVSIKGGKKVEGVPPSPSGTVNFTLDKAPTMGVQKTGFDIEFTSSSNIAGAYVLIQDVSGKKAKSYFDIPLDSLKKNTFSKTSLRKLSENFNKKSLEDNTFKADVDFTEEIPAGEFCYEICVYDEDGNVSVIERVCINVEAWGGNPNIVGDWVFDRMEPEESEELSEIPCDSGESIEVSYEISSKEYFEFVLEADGGYYEIYDQVYKPLDFEKTKETCSAVYGEETQSKDKYIGNWAYNAKRGTIAVVDFAYEDLLDPSNNETYSEGEVYLTDTKASVINNELHLTENYVDNQGNESSETYIFKRK